MGRPPRRCGAIRASGCATPCTRRRSGRRESWSSSSSCRKCAGFSVGTSPAVSFVTGAAGAPPRAACCCWSAMAICEPIASGSMPARWSRSRYSSTPTPRLREAVGSGPQRARFCTNRR